MRTQHESAVFPWVLAIFTIAVFIGGLAAGASDVVDVAPGTGLIGGAAVIWAIVRAANRNSGRPPDPP